MNIIDHQFFAFNFYLCSFFFLKAYLSSYYLIFPDYFSLGMLMIPALLFCLPLDRDLSDLLFLLILFKPSPFWGLLEFKCIYLSVIRDWLCGTFVLFSLMRQVKPSIYFSTSIRFLLHSCSSWFILKLSSLILSVTPLSIELFIWIELLLINFTQIYIFLLI